jgi:hypothetical protein
VRGFRVKPRVLLFAAVLITVSLRDRSIAQKAGSATPMIAASSAVAVQLTISPRANRPNLLYPEQTADFDIVLRNTGGQAVTVEALEGNLDTPVIRLFAAQGLIGQFDKRAMAERMAGDASTLMQPAPKMVSIAAGGASATWVNLWAFRPALPPGRYAVDVAHKMKGARITSERLDFEIVPVRIRDVALGYDWRSRSQSLLAWLAAPEGAPRARLLVRQSGSAGHGSLSQGATDFGEYDPAARVALSRLPWLAQMTPIQWVAVFSPDGTADLIRQAAAFPQGRPLKVTLGIRSPVPVPLFPNRGHAVVMATGLSEKGPALAGAVVNEDGAQAAWHVSLPSLPGLSACAFDEKGGIQLLLVTDDGRQSTARRMEVDENGKLLSQEETIRETPNAIVAVAVGQRSSDAFFLVLEADRMRHDRIALLRIPTKPDAKITTADLGHVKGWPMNQTSNGLEPASAQNLYMEQALDGSVWLAMTDSRGDLYCGKPSDALGMVREAKGSGALFPYVASLRNETSCFAFTAAGQMLAPASSAH